MCFKFLLNLTCLAARNLVFHTRFPLLFSPVRLTNCLVMPANYQQEEQSEIHLKISRIGTWHLARLAGVKSQACCLVAIDTTIAISSCFNGANMVKKPSDHPCPLHIDAVILFNPSDTGRAYIYCDQIQ